MYIPKFWARATADKLCCLGWSDGNAADAERLARERLGKMQSLKRGDIQLADWDYYPALPVKEEILETPTIPGITTVITRNRAGVQVLNTDQVAFIDIDLPEPSGSTVGFLKKLFGKPAPAPDPAAESLARVQGWAEHSGALLRAYRTARGLRLIRMDKLMDPAAEETQRMFSALGTDPQYQRLCKIQKSFRARLTPKPRRVGLSASPGSHPRTEAAESRALAAWLEKYERACQPWAVCSVITRYGTALPIEAARFVADLHDRRTLKEGGTLA